MSETQVISDMAGRVCSIAAEIGTSVADGDDVIVVEAMKMEIPVTSPADGKVVNILVKIDDVIAEGQVVAIVSA